MKKIICLVLALLMLLPTVVACGTAGGNEEITTTAPVSEQVTEKDTEAQTEASDVPTEYDISKFNIVYNSASDLDYASNLKVRIKEKCGVDRQIKRDTSSKGKYEILVGNTKRDLSNTCYTDMYDTYFNQKGVVCDNGSVQVLGLDPITVMFSIEYFCSSVLKADSTNITLPKK